MNGRRAALLGFSIERNRFAPLAEHEDFAHRWFEGAAMLADARAPAPRMLAEMPGFVADMDATGPWRPCPILLAMAAPNGPVRGSVFAEMTAIWGRGVEALRREVDGVYCGCHGAGLAEGDDDPEGARRR
jgi:microcystin degradation protein MlrC